MPEPARPKAREEYFSANRPALGPNFRKELLFGSVSALVHHDASRIVDHDFSFLLYSASAHFNDAPLRLRFGFAFFENLRFRIQRVTCEQGIRQFDFIPSERESVFTYIRDAHACNNREREGAVDQTFSELGAFTVFVIEMNLVGIVGEEGEPNIVKSEEHTSELQSLRHLVC